MIHIYPSNKKIYLKFLNCPKFTEVVTILKSYHCLYDPDTYSWCIPISKYNDILEEIDQYDLYTILRQDEVDIILNPIPKIKRERNTFSLSDLKFPPIVGKHPYENYQLEDIQKSINRDKFGLYLDTGTGKSFIMLSAINILRSKNKFNKILYITSNSGVYDIKEKFLQFTDIKEDRIQIGNKVNRRPFDLDCDVVICNYRSFLLISDEYQKDKDKGRKTKKYRSTPISILRWLDGNKGCCVLDESHNIAIPTSRQTYVIHLIKNYFDYRYILSGTPADKEEKYYSQLKFLDDALVKNLSYYEWLDYYADIGNKFSMYAINRFKLNKIKELQSIVKENCSRRIGEDILDLPPNIIKELYTNFHPTQKEIYEGFIQEQIKLKRGSISGKDFKNLFPKLIMAVDNPEKIDMNNITNPKLQKLVSSFSFKNHPKVDMLLDILQDHEDSKIIIWTSHPHVGFNIQKILKDKDPFILNGEIEVLKEYKTKDEYKNAVVEEFKRDKKRNILIAGIQVLNTAVTIIECNVQIYFDTDYNYTNTEQSVARIHRIGQKNTVYTYKLLIKNSLDITRNNIMKDKDFLNNKFLSQEYLDTKLLQDLVLGR